MFFFFLRNFGDTFHIILADRALMWLSKQVSTICKQAPKRSQLLQRCLYLLVWWIVCTSICSSLHRLILSYGFQKPTYAMLSRFFFPCRMFKPLQTKIALEIKNRAKKWLFQPVLSYATITLSKHNALARTIPTEIQSPRLTWKLPYRMRMTLLFYHWNYTEIS